MKIAIFLILAILAAACFYAWKKFQSKNSDNEQQSNIAMAEMLAASRRLAEEEAENLRKNTALDSGKAEHNDVLSATATSQAVVTKDEAAENDDENDDIEEDTPATASPKANAPTNRQSNKSKKNQKQKSQDKKAQPAAPVKIVEAAPATLPTTVAPTLAEQILPEAVIVPEVDVPAQPLEFTQVVIEEKASQPVAETETAPAHAEEGLTFEFSSPITTEILTEPVASAEPNAEANKIATIEDDALTFEFSSPAKTTTEEITASAVENTEEMTVSAIEAAEENTQLVEEEIYFAPAEDTETEKPLSFDFTNPTTSMLEEIADEIYLAPSDDEPEPENNFLAETTSSEASTVAPVSFPSLETLEAEIIEAVLPEITEITATEVAEEPFEVNLFADTAEEKPSFSTDALSFNAETPLDESSLIALEQQDAQAIFEQALNLANDVPSLPEVIKTAAPNFDLEADFNQNLFATLAAEDKNKGVDLDVDFQETLNKASNINEPDTNALLIADHIPSAETIVNLDNSNNDTALSEEVDLLPFLADPITPPAPPVKATTTVHAPVAVPSVKFSPINMEQIINKAPPLNVKVTQVIHAPETELEKNSIIFHEVSDSAPGANNPNLGSNNHKIMIVDDSKVVRIKTSRVLASAGFEVVTAEDGLDALRNIQQNGLPDVMITDVEMPILDGMELAEIIRRHPKTSQLPLVMITSHTDTHRARAAELNVNVYLGKPYADEVLISHIRGLRP